MAARAEPTHADEDSRPTSPLSRRDPSAEPPSLVDRVKVLLEWWKKTRPARALTRYSQANGALLCGGIAYSAIFSLFAGLTIGYTVFMAVLGSNTELLDSVTRSIDSMLPGLLKTSTDSSGLLDPSSLVRSTPFSAASIIAVVVLLVSATSCMSAIRAAVRVMFGLPAGGGNAVHTKLRELGGFLTVALAVLLSAVMGIAVNTVTSWLLSLLGLEGGSRVAVTVASVVVSFVIDMGVFALIVILLAGVRPPRRDLLYGSLIVAVAFGVIRFLGTSVVARGAQTNPILASFAVIVTLLIWINLSARIVLTAAAYTADLPLAILQQESDEAAALGAIEKARRSRSHEAELSERLDAAEERERSGAGRRLLLMAAAATVGFVVGRRSREDREAGPSAG